MKFLFTAFFFLVNAAQSFADTTLIPGEQEKGYEELGKSIQDGSVQLYDIPSYIQYLTDKLVWLVSFIAVFIVMFGGYKYYMGSFKDDVSEAKETLLNVIIGLVFAVFAWMIVDLIVRLLTE